MSTSEAKAVSLPEPIWPNLLEHYLGYLATRLLLFAPEHPFLRQTARPFIDEVFKHKRCRRMMHRLSPESRWKPGTLSEAAAVIADNLDWDLEHPANADHPLVLLARTYDLWNLELDLLMLAALPDLDERFGELFKAFPGSLGHRLRVAGALRVLTSERTDRSQVREKLALSRLWEERLLRLEDAGAQLFDRVLEPSAALLTGLDGRLPATLDCGPRVERFDARADHGTLIALELREPLLREAQEITHWIQAVGPGVVHVPARDPAQAQLFAQALAFLPGQPLVRVPQVDQAIAMDALGEGMIAALLNGGMLSLELGPEVESLAPPRAWKPTVSVLLLTSNRCTLAIPSGVPFRRVPQMPPRPAEQEKIWSRLLQEVGGTAQVNLLANRTHLGVVQIERTVRLAAEYARDNGGYAPRDEDVARALAEVAPAPESPLATTRHPQVPWKSLILEPRAKGLLGGLLRRVRDRVTVQDRWHMAGIEGRGNGIVALLHGESGTGKTLAAEATATRLGLPLLAVDLSRVVSKYIGETEKNLSDLFALADGFQALLFFDEADALFGKRTGVSDAHDRYANIEVNFLLQQLEGFEGLAILATNLLQNVDDAFMRRLQFAISFPRPTPGEQLRIWRLQLRTAEEPERLAADMDLDEIVARFDLVGGDIRNAALSAAYGAAARDGIITQVLLREAIKQELVKKGRPVPAD